jgi:hypothetical protein
MTGLSRQAFSLLHDLLFSSGRPQLMPSTAQLGLFLFFIASTMGHKHLCMIFGITPSTCSEIINKMLKLVVHKLKRHWLAMVKFPNVEKMENFASLINQRKPQVDDVIGFMDGVARTSECTSEPIEQNVTSTSLVAGMMGL